MFAVDAHVSVTYQPDNSNLLKQLHFLFNFWPPRKLTFVTSFTTTHLKVGHDNGKKWLLSKAHVSSISDLLVNPKIIEKN